MLSYVVLASMSVTCDVSGREEHFILPQHHAPHATRLRTVHSPRSAKTARRLLRAWFEFSGDARPRGLQATRGKPCMFVDHWSDITFYSAQ